jgi:hypothetical protein
MPVVNTTNTFTNNEQITSTKLNDIMDNSSFVSGAVVTSGGLEITAGGQMQVATSGITTARIADSNVTTVKIADGSVTPAKLSSGKPIWDTYYTEVGRGVTGTYFLSLTPYRTSDGETQIIIGAQTATNANAQIIRQTGVDGQLVIQNNGTAPIIMTSSSGVTFGSANMPNPVGSAPIYGCRAWVNFDATRDSSGATNALNTNRFIRSSGNVTSVKKDSTGRYRVTFTTPMLDANYAAIVGGDANAQHKIPGVITQDTAYVDIGYSQINTSTAREDPDWGSVVIMR